MTFWRLALSAGLKLTTADRGLTNYHHLTEKKW
jgi:hypothetical protein